MKVRLLFIMWIGWGIGYARPVQGSYAHMFFSDLVKTSEIIAEGKIIEQAEINKEAKLTVDVCRKISVFKISKVYKGDFRAGETVSVLSDFGFVCNTCRLENGVSYLLMLKHRSDGYIDVNNGQGTYHIIDLGKNCLAVVSSDSLTKGVQLVDQFRADLAWVMNQPKTAASQPVISKEAARKIAMKELANTGIDLGDYQEREAKLFKHGPARVGFAYEGDWVWMFNWRPSEKRDENPSLPDSLVPCYVNALTGKTYCGSKRVKDELSLPDRCRVFLATYGPCRKTYRDVVRLMKFKYVTGEEVTDLFSEVRNLYFSPQKEYPEGTSFLYGEFPSVTKLQPVLFVLNEEGNVEFIGVFGGTKD